MAKKKPKKKPPRGIPTGSASSSSSQSKTSSPESSKSADVNSKSLNSLAMPESPVSSAIAETVDSCKLASPASIDAAIGNPSSEIEQGAATVATLPADVPANSVGEVAATTTDVSITALAVPIPATAEQVVPPKQSHPASTASTQVEPAKSPAHSDSPWKDLVKDSSIKMQKRGTPFTLESGEACVTIPNSVIEKNKKAWDCFILGQFYEDPPHRAAVQAIVNGIWSRQRRDIKE